MGSAPTATLHGATDDLRRCKNKSDSQARLGFGFHAGIRQSATSNYCSGPGAAPSLRGLKL